MTSLVTRRSFVAGAAVLPFAASAVVRAAEPDLAGLADLARDAAPIDAAV